MLSVRAGGGLLELPTATLDLPYPHFNSVTSYFMNFETLFLYPCEFVSVTS